MVRIVLRDYLGKLKDVTRDRRNVPTIQEFIKAAGTTESNFYKFLRNDQRSINRDFLDSSINLLQSCGFDTQVGDIIEHTKDREGSF